MAEIMKMTASSTNTNTNHDQTHTLSGKEMEGENGLKNTLESLRGRLLAERHTSRAAKEEAVSLENKFVELENKIREEIKLRDKAQRKLELLKKKLESLNISVPSEKLEHSEAKPHITNPTLSENYAMLHNHNVEESSTFIQKNHNNLDTALILCMNPNQSSENLRNDHSSSNPNPNPSYDEIRLSSLKPKSSVTQTEDDNEDLVDNSLALVPVSFPATSNATKNHKPIHENVLEALDALKCARERLLCTLRTRSMIKVCPTH